MNTRPFSNPTTSSHSNTRLVGDSDAQYTFKLLFTNFVCTLASLDVMFIVGLFVISEPLWGPCSSLHKKKLICPHPHTQKTFCGRSWVLRNLFFNIIHFLDHSTILSSSYFLLRVCCRTPIVIVTYKTAIVLFRESPLSLNHSCSVATPFQISPSHDTQLLP